MIELDPAMSALILIDLQKGVLGMPLAPRSAADVLATGKGLAERFRAAKSKVVLVPVAFAEDFADALTQPVDQPMMRPPGGPPRDWNELADGLAAPGDIRIVKRQWGAFHGAELDGLRCDIANVASQRT